MKTVTSCSEVCTANKVCIRARQPYCEVVAMQPQRKNPTGFSSGSVKKVCVILIALFVLNIHIIPFSLATDTSSLLNGLTHVWHLGSEADSVGGYTLTSTNVTNVTGVYGTAYNYTTSTTSFSYVNSSLNNTAFSANCWAKFYTVPYNSLQAVFSTNQISANVYGFSMGYTSNYSFYARIAGVSYTSPITYSIGTQYMMSVMYESSNLRLYVNTSNLINQSPVSYTASSSMQIGRLSDALVGYVARGVIDECYYWNRTLTQTELNLLYNSGYGCFYPFNCTFFFNGTILSPANNTRSNQKLNASFQVARLNESNFSCSIYINNQLNQTNSSVQANTLTNFYINDMDIEGSYSWILGCENENFTQNASTYTYYYDPNEPVITLSSPSYINTSVFDSNIYIVGNITDNSLYRVNHTITAPNGSTVFNDYSGDLPANTTIYDLTQTIASWQLPNGTYTYFIEAVDSHTSTEFKENIIVEENTKDEDYNLQLSTDTLNFKLSEDMGITFIKDFDRIKFEFDSKGIYENKQIKIQPTEPLVKIKNSQYACHYVFGKYWFDCEGLEKPIESFDKATNTLTIDFDMNTDKVTTDSLGGLNENNLSLTFEIDHTCTPNWTAQYGSCQLNDSYQLTYTDTNTCGTPLNLPSDNGTWFVCDYCTSDIISTATSSCYHNGSFDYQNFTYSDNNFASCCLITGLYSDCLILFEPYNTTYLQRCYISTDQFSVQFDEHADYGLGNDKVYWAINLNDTSDYKCTTYVITEEGRLIQTSPTYTKQSDTLIKLRDTNYEDREFFNIDNGIGNVYFTKSNLIFDGRDYLFGVQCAGNNQTLKSERWVIVGYENINSPLTRYAWLPTQALVIAFIIIIIAFLLLIIWVVRK